MLFATKFYKIFAYSFLIISASQFNACKPPSKRGSYAVQNTQSEDYLKDFTEQEIAQLVYTSGQIQTIFNNPENNKSIYEAKVFLNAFEDQKLTKKNIIEYLQSKDSVKSVMSSDENEVEATQVNLLPPTNTQNDENSRTIGTVGPIGDERLYSISSNKSFGVFSGSISGNLKVKINDFNSNITSIITNTSNLIIDAGSLVPNFNAILQDNLKNTFVFYPYKSGVLLLFKSNITINNSLISQESTEEVITKKINNIVKKISKVLQ